MGQGSPGKITGVRLFNKGISDVGELITAHFKMNIKFVLPFLFVLGISISWMGCSSRREGVPRVLVFTRGEGFEHTAIPEGVKAVQELGAKYHFAVDTTADSEKFTEDTLKKYSAVIFLQTAGSVLDARQQADFERYIQAGGGYVGIHAASDRADHWPWYGKLVGAYFDEHLPLGEAKLVIHQDRNFPVTDSLSDPWVMTDEWYHFNSPLLSIADDQGGVLVSINEKGDQGGSGQSHQPMAWYHDYDGGRAFYMAWGHGAATYTEPDFLKLLGAGIQYAIEDGAVPDYRKVRTLRKPDEDRFTKTFLAGGLFEPTEMTVMPNLDILIAERRGGVKFYDHADQVIKEVAHLDVYYEGLTPGGRTECGLLGLQADPHYDQNHWIYAYYSPTGNKSVDRLSRFKFENDQFDLQSEQVILEVSTDREICCHTGGSIAFDADDNLYLSVGDNTIPFNEMDPKTGKPYPVNVRGFAPLDDRPGYAHYDDRRAAGNSNDLRGKILRIIVNEDGSYRIPPGNLFPEGTAGTRPEIYVMGDRNPYRISVDKHSGYLYWGEVGPDAGNDSLATRGPRGYDEINQARKAGNFGWPYFVGNNYPYREYNYNTGEPGQVFDPAQPVNHSRNNTGIKNLPPAQPAFIWYPYARSADFPILGTGGRTAMAGPVYYIHDYPEPKRYPDYYNGKLFIYEWTRDWIMAVTMDKEGDLQTIEPFMPHTRFHHISDMEAGPDGQLYIVEYGEQWRHKNANAALSVIAYNGGNRAPAAALEADITAGALPLTVHFSAEHAVDPDGDKLSYSWDFGAGKKEQTSAPAINHTFSTAGTYPVSVAVSDGNGGETKSPVVYVYAGNSIPQVNFIMSGNPSFYFPDRPVRYEVQVNDAEDGHTGQPGFDVSKVKVHAHYLKNPDKAALSPDKAAKGITELSGKSLMEALDCQSCHQVEAKSVGPAFKEVALQYKDNKRAMEFLPEKIISGGSGNWGETMMAAHPDLALSDAKKIVTWILSLADTGSKHSMPLKGSFLPPEKFELTPRGAIVLTASYTDNGGKGISPLTGNAIRVLRSPVLPAGSADAFAGGVTNVRMAGTAVCRIADKGWIKFSRISLQDIQDVQIAYAVDQSTVKGWKVALRLDDAEGALAGSAVIGSHLSPKRIAEDNMKLEQPTDDKLHDIYFVFQKLDKEEEAALGISAFRLRENR